MIVFRSIAVPLKATLGYLLSVGAALGAVVVVFQWGWARQPGARAVAKGPIVSFLPIFVMGVLFGLAMDYEMFLVSAMREHYVQSGDAHQAVHGGFRASSRVVTAAALIMTSVFVAFIPGGTSTIKQIALGLAVGVFVDAFVVRMTLVPGRPDAAATSGAWWLPGLAGARRCPSVDVEGAALHRRVAFDGCRASHGEIMLLARDVTAEPGAPGVDVTALVGEVGRVAVPAGADPTAVARVLAGRRPAARGELVIDGLLLPEQREAVFQRTALLELSALDRSEGSVEDRVRDRVRMLSLSRRRRAELDARARQLGGRAGGGGDPAGRRRGDCLRRGRGGPLPHRRRRRLRAQRAGGAPRRRP